MWLIIVSYLAVLSTILWYVNAENDKLLLKYLALISWGASIMIFIDHLYGYLTGNGEFLDVSIDSTILGFALTLFIMMIWMVILLVKDPKRVWRKTT